MPKIALDVLAFNCSLKSTREEESSSTDVLLNQMLSALSEHGANGEIVRAVDSISSLASPPMRVTGTPGPDCVSELSMRISS